MEPHFARNTASSYLHMLTHGLGMSYSSRIYTDRTSLKRDLEEKKLDFVLISSMDLIRGEMVPGFRPVLAPKAAGEVGHKFLVLVHQHSGFQSLEDLKSRHLLVFSDSDAGLEDAWLNRELARRNLPAARDFFRLIDRPMSAPRTVLPVFFRKADACIIPASLLELVAASNPQVKMRLLPLVQSEAFLTTVMCLREDFPAKARTTLINAAVQISSQPEAGNFISMTRVSQVTKFEDHMLDSVRELLQARTPLATTAAGSGSRGPGFFPAWPALPAENGPQPPEEQPAPVLNPGGPK